MRGESSPTLLSYFAKIYSFFKLVSGKSWLTHEFYRNFYRIILCLRFWRSCFQSLRGVSTLVEFNNLQHKFLFTEYYHYNEYFHYYATSVLTWCHLHLFSKDCFLAWSISNTGQYNYWPSCTYWSSRTVFWEKGTFQQLIVTKWIPSQQTVALPWWEGYLILTGSKWPSLR